MEVLFGLVFIAGVLWIPYKIYKVVYVGEKPSDNQSYDGWKCPKCGLVNNLKGSTSCFCGYDKNKPQIERQENRHVAQSTSKIINTSYEPPPTSNNIDDFDNLAQTALKSALFEKNYEVLGLRPNATIDEVRERSKELVKQWHPDLHKHDLEKHKQATIKIQEIKAAYEAIISDSDKVTKTASTSKTSNTQPTSAAVAQARQELLASLSVPNQQNIPQHSTHIQSQSSQVSDKSNLSTLTEPIRMGLWFHFWTYVSLPLGTLIGAVATFGLFSKGSILLALLFFILLPIQLSVIYGLHTKKLWAWQWNWVLIVLSYISMMIPYPTPGTSRGELALQMVIKIILASLIWLWPNIVYWNKRKHRFC